MSLWFKCKDALGNQPVECYKHKFMPDWGWLDDCFGKTGIQLSDVDGLVERHGYFLQIEKKNSGAPLSEGQHKLFVALAETGRFNILVIWQKSSGAVTHMKRYCRNNPRGLPCYESSRKEVHDFVERWFAWANKQSRPLAWSAPSRTLNEASPNDVSNQAQDPMPGMDAKQ